MNIHTVTGRIGKVYDLRFFEDGNATLNFSVATTETWKDKRTNEKKERTDWHNITMKGKRAEGIAKHLVKGMYVTVSGPSVTRDYKDREGNMKRTTEIRARDLTICWAPKNQRQQVPADNGGGRGGDFGNDAPGGDNFGPDDTDDLPF